MAKLSANRPVGMGSHFSTASNPQWDFKGSVDGYKVTTFSSLSRIAEICAHDILLEL